MTTDSKQSRAGIFEGGQHSEAKDIPITLIDSKTHIRIEGGEFNFPEWVQQDKTVYKRTGTNYEVLQYLFKLIGANWDEKVTHVKSGDIIICIRSAFDNDVRTYEGTITQILSAINESCGCKHVESGATMTNHETGETIKMLYGGEIKSAPNYHLLSEAKELIKTRSELEVWKTTGWIFNKHDGKWRFEINDKGSNMKMSLEEIIENFKKSIYSFPLSKVLSHDNFYYLYPEAKNIIFGIENRPLQEELILAESFINGENKFIILLTIKIDPYDIIGKNYERSKSLLGQTKAIIIHELQHFLQERHSFGKAKGIEQIRREIQQNIDRVRLRANVLKDEDKKQSLLDEAKEIELNKEYFVSKIYNNQPAEKEAWDAYYRINLSEQERNKIPPYPIKNENKLSKGGQFPNLNNEGGYDYKGKEEKVANHVGLITLPKDIKATNCSNCIFQKDGFCDHEKILLPVTKRMCCALWSEKSIDSAISNITKADFFPSKKLREKKYPLNSNGGYDYVGSGIKKAKAVDLITLPNKLVGTNCANCKFINKDNFCIHPKIQLPVTAHMSCSLWDAEGVLRSWKGGATEIFFKEGGASSLSKEAPWILADTVLEAPELMALKNGGRIAQGYIIAPYSKLKGIFGEPNVKNNKEKIGWYMAIDKNHIGAIWTESDKSLKKIMSEKFHKWFLWGANDESQRRLYEATRAQVKDIDPEKQKAKDKAISVQRWIKKREHIKELSNNIHNLRAKLSRDLNSDDEQTFLIAIIVSIMDKTGERVGNIKSAECGHFGVTCFTRDHVKVIGNKILLDYVGKTGVPHVKDFSNAKIAKALKLAIKNSPKEIKGEPNEFIFVTSKGRKMNDADVNEYVKPYHITSKGIRGYFANRNIIKKLESSDIPESEKERKKIFNKAVKETAGIVQHGASTLKKHYMIPELMDEYVLHGRIIDMKKLGYYDKGGKIEEETGDNKDFANSEESRKSVSTNITEDEINQVISGTRPVTGERPAQTASAFLKRNAGTGKKSDNSELYKIQEAEHLKDNEGSSHSELLFTGESTKPETPIFVSVDRYFFNKKNIPEEVNQAVDDLYQKPPITEFGIKEFTKTLPEEEINFKDIVPTQDELDVHKLEGYISKVNSGADFPPIFGVRYNGKIYLNDGHHRAVAFYINDKPIRGAIYDLDENINSMKEKNIDNSELKKGIEVEKEHKDLYFEIKRRLNTQGIEMPITENEFYSEIAKVHIKEKKDYYDLLEKYVEKYTNNNKNIMKNAGKIKEFKKEDVIYTPSFKKWFGDWEKDPKNSSKVVDENGEPLVVYHGTGTTITEFKSEYLGQGNDQLGSGFYFTNSIDEAEAYTTNTINKQPKLGGSENPNVISVFLDIKNPLYETTPDKSTTSQIQKMLEASPDFEENLWNFGDWKSEGKSKTTKQAVDAYKDSYDTLLRLINDIGNDFYRGHERELLEQANKIYGYDGIKHTFENGKTHFVVWFPTQIKLADGTNKEFNPNNPDIRYEKGGIPDRYKNMGFSKVGQKKKSTRPQKKWMVLAKKGDKYKVVHGGQKGMQDFSQHRDKDRQKRFWNRMGGFDSEKASDPFRPLYWHKRFGTWEKGGILEDGTIKVVWVDTKEPETFESKMFDSIDEALKDAEGKTFLIMELEEQDDNYYKWNLLPYGEYKRYKRLINWSNIFQEGAVVENNNFVNSQNTFLQKQIKSIDKINRESNQNNLDIRKHSGGVANKHNSFSEYLNNHPELNERLLNGDMTPELRNEFEQAYIMHCGGMTK